MIKLNDDPLAWALADRALQAAQAGDDPLTLADSRRAVATVLRRTGHRTSAHDLLTRAASDIEPGGHPSPDQLSVYGTLLEVAAYTAAVDGNRGAARELHRRSPGGRHPARPRRQPPLHRLRPRQRHPLPSQHRPGPRRQRNRHRTRQDTAACRHPHRRTPRPVLDRRSPRLPPMGQTRTLLSSAAGRRTRRTRRSTLPPARPPDHRRSAPNNRRNSLPGLPRLRSPHRPSSRLTAARPDRWRWPMRSRRSPEA